MKTVESVAATAQAKKASPFFIKNGVKQDFFGTAGTEGPFFSRNHSGMLPIQTKLTIGQPDDEYEREADIMADKVIQRLAMPDVLAIREPQVQTKPLAASITPLVQTKCTGCEQEEKMQMKEEEEVQQSPLELQRKPIFESNAEPPDDENTVQRKCAECEKKESLQRKESSSAGAAPAHAIESGLNATRGTGFPLSKTTREQMETSFGADFSAVRIHHGSEAVQLSRNLNAQAFTNGRDIYFDSGKFNPGSREGKSLLAHELTHVVQQKNMVQRQPAPESETQKPKLPKLNYKNAKAQNISFSHEDSLGWGTKLETVAAGLHKGWFDLWKAGKYDEFADTVAQYQADQGAKKRQIDGVLGLGTWSKIAGYGEAVAGIQSVKWEASKKTCTIASKERIERGHKLSKGTRFALPKDKLAKTFNTILQSIEGNMADIDEVYRGTGAAGAMVYAGKATFVPEADIWTGGLRPGAAMQVWGYRAGYDLMRKGVVEYKVKGVTKTRRIRPTDANFYGTSFVFVRYDDPKNPTKMLVRHFDAPEWKSTNSYAVWVAANIN